MALSQTMETYFLGNSLESYIWFFGWVLLALVVRKFIPNIVLKLLHRIFKKQLYGVSFERLKTTPGKALGNFLFIALLFVAFQYIDFPPSWNLVGVEEFGL